jgi:hypothetical protein
MYFLVILLAGPGLETFPAVSAGEWQVFFVVFEHVRFFVTFFAKQLLTIVALDVGNSWLETLPLHGTVLSAN